VAISGPGVSVTFTAIWRNGIKRFRIVFSREPADVPGSYRPCCGQRAWLGRDAEAKAARADLLKLNPHFSAKSFVTRLYADGAPLPDQGMFLAPRRADKAPIVVWNACASKLHGLPEQLSI
jgi:hypothetical protein